MAVDAQTVETALALTRRFLIGIGLIGVLIFSALFSFTFADQDTIKRHASGFIQHQIKTEMKQKNAALSESKYSDQLDGLKAVFEKDLALGQAYIDGNLDQLIANVIAAKCNLNCEKREGWRQSIRAGLDENLKRTGVSLETVESLISGKYDQIVSALRTDLRIYLGTNIVMFALVGLALLLRKKASLQLIVPAALLTLSAFISISLYVFGQNWFYTLLYSNFWGYAYTGYAGLIFLSLLDVFLNRARVTSRTMNGIFTAMGSALSVVPC